MPFGLLQAFVYSRVRVYVHGLQIASIFLVLTGNKMFWDLPPGTSNTCKELDSPEDEGVEPRDYMPYSYMIMAQVFKK